MIIFGFVLAKKLFFPLGKNWDYQQIAAACWVCYLKTVEVVFGSNSPSLVSLLRQAVLALERA